MPLYDFKCDGCEHIWETWHSIHEDPNLKCPECESDKTRIFVSSSVLHVKGSNVAERMLADREGVKRDRDLYKLEHDDPYASIRPEGDKEVVKQKLINAGKVNHDKHGNPTGKKFYMSK